VPPKRSQKPKFQNFHFFARPLCQNASRQRLRTDFILHPTGPASQRPYAFEGGPLNFGPPRRFTPKKFFPNFPKIIGAAVSFSSALHEDPQGPSGIKFRQLYLGLLPRKKNSEISPKIDDFSSYAKIPIQEKYHYATPPTE